MSNKHFGENDLPLIEEIKNYYIKRALKRPNIWQALGWVTAELGEVYEVLLSWEKGWVRNNPQDHPVKSKEDLAEELGDVIFMLIVAGIEEGVDPIQALKDKMKRKLGGGGMQLWNPDITTDHELTGEEDGRSKR